MTSPNQPVRRPTNWLALAVAAALGFVIAAGGHATWQAPVENGQIAAGLVPYTPASPYAVYLDRLWCLPNQIATAVLAMGASEITASVLLAGLLGGLSFTALAVLVTGLGAGPTAAVFIPLFVHLSGHVGVGVCYPIWLMGTSHAFGIAGLSWTVLVLGLLGCGWWRLAAFCLGLAPAVHPSYGAFALLAIAPAGLLLRRTLRPHLRGLAQGLALGLVCTAVSYACHIRLSHGPTGLELGPAERRLYVEAFIAHYDVHRQVPSLRSPGVVIALMSLLVAGAAARRNKLPVGIRLVAAALGSSVLASAVLAACAQEIPRLWTIKTLIPWRFLNLANLTFVPFVLGLLLSKHGTVAAWRIGGAVGLLALAVAQQGGIVGGSEWFYHACTLVILPFLAFPLPDRCPAGEKTTARQVAFLTCLLGAVILAGRTLPSPLRSLLTGGYRSPPRFTDRSNCAFYAAIAARPGLLLTAADLHLIQLKSRRAVLLDGGALDYFCYLPDTGPALNRILNRVYGLDLFIPPPIPHRNRGVITELHRPLWENRTPDEWQAIGGEWGVTDVLTPETWILQLPRVITGQGLALYSIPLP